MQHRALQRELDDAYLAQVEAHLQNLTFRGGVAMSARLGQGNKGYDHTLLAPADKPATLLERLLGKRASAFRYKIADRDEAGARALAELKDRGLNLSANALAQAAAHILGFFARLRKELAFYVGCINLHEFGGGGGGDAG